MQLKQEFMTCVNRSCSGGGMLTCSLRETEFADYFLFKKKNAGHLEVKHSVCFLGLQIDDELEPKEESVWVFSPKVIIDRKGAIVPIKDSSFFCLETFHSRVPITLPLRETAISDVVSVLKILLQHNFVPGVLALGAGIMQLHYAQQIRRRGHCHVPVLCGPSQTGKTTALKFALSLFGCHSATFFSRGTKEAYLKKCSSSTFPVGCDDPVSPAVVGQLIVELFNGAKTTLCKGDLQPISGCVISANFNLSDRAKHVSRALLIEFQLPEVGNDPTAEAQELWDETTLQMKRASVSSGVCIAIGSMLEDRGYSEIRERFNPLVRGALYGAQPRVISGYATLLWCTEKLLEACQMSDVMMEVKAHFLNSMAPSLVTLQKAAEKPSSPSMCIINCVKQLSDIAKGLDKELVKTFCNIDHHQRASDQSKNSVVAIRYENIPTGISGTPIFAKQTLTRAIASSDQFGINNQTKAFGAKREKGSLIFLRVLMEQGLEDVLKVFPDVRKDKGSNQGTSTKQRLLGEKRVREEEEEKLREEKRVREEEEKLREEKRVREEEEEKLREEKRVHEEEEEKLREEKCLREEEENLREEKRVREEEEKLREEKRVCEEEEEKLREEKRVCEEEEEKLREEKRVREEEEKLREEKRVREEEEEKLREEKRVREEEEEKLREEKRVREEEEEKLREEKRVREEEEEKLREEKRVREEEEEKEKCVCEEEEKLRDAHLKRTNRNDRLADNLSAYFQPPPGKRKKSRPDRY